MRALSFLGLMTGLSSMSGLTASRANVMLFVMSAVAAPGELPVKTEWGLICSGDESIVGIVQCKGVCTVPHGVFGAVANGMLIAAQT